MKVKSKNTPRAKRRRLGIKINKAVDPTKPDTDADKTGHYAQVNDNDKQEQITDKIKEAKTSR